MTKVFIAGSRKLSRLSPEVKARIDTMIEKGFTILIGDANGADKAVQRYLADQDYRSVIIHCMTANCRNNVGDWPTQEIAAPQGARGFAYYSIKDQAMVDAAEYGFMLWDGESKGTLNSVINMARQDKPVIVYLATKKIFQNIRSWLDVDDLLSNCDRASVQRFERELGIDLSERLSHPRTGSRSTSPSAAARNGSIPRGRDSGSRAPSRARRPRAPARGRSEAERHRPEPVALSPDVSAIS